MSKEQDAAPQGDYEVGYRRPPKANQFKKGKSGNPTGKKKARPVEDLRVTIEEILDEQIQVGLQGDHKATRALLELAQKAGLLSRSERSAGLVNIVEPDGDHGSIVKMFHADPKARGSSHNRQPLAHKKFEEGANNA